VADKPDSQEICFVPRGSYTDVVARFRPEALRPGPILDTSGEVIGEHQGIARYTIGQRRGLGLSGSEPRYVVGIDARRNAVIVGDADDLLCDELTASDMNWIGVASLGAPRRVTARLRHAAADVEAMARPGTHSGDVVVQFAQPQRIPSAGQAVALYDGEAVVGGGVITEVRTPARTYA
jgi:tRNA-specific 2-thiouridylase